MDVCASGVGRGARGGRRPGRGVLRRRGRDPRRPGLSHGRRPGPDPDTRQRGRGRLGQQLPDRQGKPRRRVREGLAAAPRRGGGRDRPPRAGPARAVQPAGGVGGGHGPVPRPRQGGLRRRRHRQPPRGGPVRRAQPRPRARAGQEHERLLRGLRHLDLERVHPPRRLRLPADLHAGGLPARGARHHLLRARGPLGLRVQPRRHAPAPAGGPGAARLRRLRDRDPEAEERAGRARPGSTAPTSSGSCARATTWSRSSPTRPTRTPSTGSSTPRARSAASYLCATVQGVEGCLYGQTIP